LTATGDVKIHPALRGTLIGPGGKQIKAIRDATGATIDVDDDSSTARIFARTVDGLEVCSHNSVGLSDPHSS